MSSFMIRINQFIDGNWQELSNLELEDSIVERKDALKNISTLAQRLMENRSMFFTTYEGTTLIISLEHGPIKMKLFKS